MTVRVFLILPPVRMGFINHDISVFISEKIPILAYMEPADLYALFGNALENAIEATEQLTDPAQKQIVLTVRPVEGFCSVHLQNYTKEPLRLENGLPVTSKQDRLNHGFGTRSMQLLVEKYGGELTFQQEADVVNIYMLLPSRPAGE